MIKFDGDGPGSLDRSWIVGRDFCWTYEEFGWSLKEGRLELAGSVVRS